MKGRPQRPPDRGGAVDVLAAVVRPDRPEETIPMTVAHCPLCELRFATRTERDWHVRNEHGHAHTHRPARMAEAEAAAPAEAVSQPAAESTGDDQQR
jgi:hypothetical protein